jgi:hypothetical protein
MNPETLAFELIAWTLKRVNAAVGIVERPALFFGRGGEEGFDGRSGDCAHGGESQILKSRAPYCLCPSAAVFKGLRLEHGFRRLRRGLGSDIFKSAAVDWKGQPSLPDWRAEAILTFSTCLIRL